MIDRASCWAVWLKFPFRLYHSPVEKFTIQFHRPSLFIIEFHKITESENPRLLMQNASNIISASSLKIHFKKYLYNFTKHKNTKHSSNGEYIFALKRRNNSNNSKLRHWNIREARVRFGKTSTMLSSRNHTVTCNCPSNDSISSVALYIHRERAISAI